jgi:hypothetical protein
MLATWVATLPPPEPDNPADSSADPGADDSVQECLFKPQERELPQSLSATVPHGLWETGDPISNNGPSFGFFANVMHGAAELPTFVPPQVPEECTHPLVHLQGIKEPQASLRHRDGRKVVVTSNGRDISLQAQDMEGSQFQIIKDSELFRCPGLPGLEDMKFKELQQQTYLKTSDDKFVIVNRRTNGLETSLSGSNPPEDALMVDKYEEEEPTIDAEHSHTTQQRKSSGAGRERASGEISVSIADPNGEGRESESEESLVYEKNPSWHVGTRRGTVHPRPREDTFTSSSSSEESEEEDIDEEEEIRKAKQRAKKKKVKAKVKEAAKTEAIQGGRRRDGRRR